MKQVLVSAFLCITLLGADARAETVLHACESLDGVSIGMGGGLDESKLFISHAAEHVTEGAGAIGASSRSPEDAPGNVYLSINLPIEPTDFTDRALVLDAATSTPEHSRAFYVRGYDAAGRMVMSWMSWDGRLASEAQQFRLTPGEDSDGLRWEADRIRGERSSVVRLELITGTGAKGVRFNVIADSVRTADGG